MNPNFKLIQKKLTEKNLEQHLYPRSKRDRVLPHLYDRAEPSNPVFPFALA
jgi:hypothetical protein